MRAATLLLAAALCLPGVARASSGEDEPALAERKAVPLEPLAPLREIGRGIASWYGAHFHGRRTASGESFDMNALTAAHPSLPFGTVVRVRSLINGKEVDVRINDRGPYVGRRLIDLSRGAAQALGLIESGAGTKPVALTILRPAAAKGAQPKAEPVKPAAASRPAPAEPPAGEPPAD